jgi:hypothetical protein
MPACSNCGIAMGPDVAVVLPPGLNDGRALVVGSPNGSVTFYPPPRASAFFVPASAAAPDTGDIISVYRPQP